MEKYGFVYIWFDRKHKRYYVGCRWGTVDDGYICSSSWMKKAFKLRSEDFKRKILKSNLPTRHSMFVEEQRYLDMIKPEEIKIRYYNLNIRNNNVWHKYDENFKTIKQKISIKTKEAMQRQEVREKYNDGLSNRDNSSSRPEVREKRSVSMKKAMAEKFPIDKRKVNGPKFGSEEYRQNMSISTKKMWKNVSEEKKREIASKIAESNRKRAKENPDTTCAGKLWWNNGIINKRSKNSPGVEWSRGKMPCKIKNKIE